VAFEHPRGLRATIVKQHPDVLEAAEIVQCPPLMARYLMNPTDRGTVFLARSSSGARELRSARTALAKVLTVEIMGSKHWAANLGDVDSKPLSGRYSHKGDLHV